VKSLLTHPPLSVRKEWVEVPVLKLGSFDFCAFQKRPNLLRGGDGKPTGLKETAGLPGKR
jgi:hypothetical protein